VAFSPDGRRIVSGSEDRTARVWDAEAGMEIPGLRLEHGSGVGGVAFSPDGGRIVTGSLERESDGLGEATLWDAGTGERLRSLSIPGAVRSVAFSPDGKLIALACGDQTARVCDAMLRDVRELGGHTESVLSVAFSPDGKRLLSGSRDHTAKVWDTESWGELLCLKGHTGIVRGGGFTPDGTRIVTVGDDRTARIWESTTGQELLGLKDPEQPIMSIACSPDGTQIVTGIAGAGGKLRLWQAAPAR
jgi:WD40 repeat protein